MFHLKDTLTGHTAERGRHAHPVTLWAELKQVGSVPTRHAFSQFYHFDIGIEN